MAPIAILAIASCSRPPVRPFEKIAILKFDDQTGNPKYAWMATAAARILADQLTVAPRRVVVMVNTVSDGYLSGATQMVHGYFDGPASFHLAIEDLATHKMVAAEDMRSSLLAAMDRASHLVSPDPKPFSTSQEENVEAWGQGNFEDAVRKDPWLQRRVAGMGSAVDDEKG